MANITLWGASYTDVPAVDLPQTGGGTVRFYESGGGGSSSATQHTISLTLWDDTTATIPVYYDDSLLDTIITSSKPLMYNNKQIAQASLDNVSWYNPVRIPLNTQLVDFSKVKDHYGIDANGAEEEYEWSSVTDYILIDPSMTFSIINYKWYAVYFYDTDKNYISRIQAQSLPDATLDANDCAHGTLTSTTIPSNAKYIRLVISLRADDTRASVIRTA